jgi:glutathione S-transferase
MSSLYIRSFAPFCRKSAECNLDPTALSAMCFRDFFGRPRKSCCFARDQIAVPGCIVDGHFLGDALSGGPKIGNFDEVNRTALAMRYAIIIGEKDNSCWSMRASILVKHLGLGFTEKTVNLYREDSRVRVRELGGQTGLVPVLIDRGTLFWDTLAIFAHLAEQQGGGAAYGAGGSLARAQPGGRGPFKFQCAPHATPVNTRARNRHAMTTPEVDADIARIEAILNYCGRPDGPWLFGTVSGAEIMFAPFATRFQNYGIKVMGGAERYRELVLKYPLVAEWLRPGKEVTSTIPMIEDCGQ